MIEKEYNQTSNHLGQKGTKLIQLLFQWCHLLQQIIEFFFTKAMDKD